MLKIQWQTAYTIMSVALALTTPLFLVFGSLSDRIGRKIEYSRTPTVALRANYRAEKTAWVAPR